MLLSDLVSTQNAQQNEHPINDMLGFTTLEPPDERATGKHDTIESAAKRGRDQDTPGFKRNGYETQQTESTLQRSSAFKRKHSETSGGESATPALPVGALTL